MSKPKEEVVVKEEFKFVPIPPFNDHANCKGHANYFLDCTYEKVEDRELLLKVLGNYIK